MNNVDWPMNWSALERDWFYPETRIGKTLLQATMMFQPSAAEHQPLDPKHRVMGGFFAQGFE